MTEELSDWDDDGEDAASGEEETPHVHGAFGLLDIPDVSFDDGFPLPSPRKLSLSVEAQTIDGMASSIFADDYFDFGAGTHSSEDDAGVCVGFHFSLSKFLILISFLSLSLSFFSFSFFFF